MKKLTVLLTIFSLCFFFESNAQVSSQPKVKVASSYKPKGMRDLNDLFAETFRITYNVKTSGSMSTKSLTGNATAGVKVDAILAVKPEILQAATDDAFKIFMKVAADNGYNFTDNTPYQNFEVFKDGKIPHTPAKGDPETLKGNTACISTTPTGFTMLTSQNYMKKAKAYKDVNALCANVSLVVNFISFDGKSNRRAGSARVSTAVDLNVGGATGCHPGFNKAGGDFASSVVGFTNNANISSILLGLEEVLSVEETNAKLVEVSASNSQTTGLMSYYHNNSTTYTGYVVTYENEQDFVKEMNKTFTALFEAYFKSLKESMN